MITYIADLRAYIGTLKQVDAYSWHFKKYTVSAGGEYLWADGHIKDKKLTRYDNPSLLFSFAGLVQLPHSYWSIEELVKKTTSDMNSDMKKAIPDKKIIKFCKKFGMPYWEEDDGKNLFLPVSDLLHEGQFFILNHIAMPQVALRLFSFRFRVILLYIHFQLWHALYSGENKNGIIDEYVKRVLIKEGSVEKTASMRLSDETAMNLRNLRITSKYEKNSNSFVLGIRALDLFDIAYFQLANLLTMKDAVVQRHLKTCSNQECGHLFWGEHGHNRYCPLCDRRTIYSRRNKKEVKNNGRMG